ncbi:hypothetical protein RSOLAG1IB_09908 [Rhizoctonia solani AG-1 IB]|uniref:Uncharacterized protein n=1 Tax=Thanatephorus cucumeris (strain AG1-IB / isolate 7/3/14) TaxID=1108050 RepID=A0A0B7FTJ3_THACB|nr:hypothetical protein RSOLAG1IB_09908 [Rhizoctonia solani AG-1 IB]
MSSLPSIARRLIFYTRPYDLTRDTTLLLSFVPANPQELYKDLYPAAWKVLRMSGGNVGSSASATYSARLAFGVRQSDNQNITIPQTHVEIRLGQLTQLSTNAEGFVHWSLPTAQQVGSDEEQKGTLKAINDTQEQRDICIGTLDTDRPEFSPMICWPRVNNGATAAVDFLPHLYIYAYSGLKETDLIRGEVENFLGNWDLSLLQKTPTDNRFHLFEDKSDGQRLRLVKD